MSLKVKEGLLRRFRRPPTSDAGRVVRLPGTRGARVRLVGWILLGAAALACVAGAGILYGWRVDEIRVTGTERIPADAVVTASGVEGGERMLLLRSRRIAERIEAMPAVRRARVGRTAGGTLELDVEERRPVARLDGHPELAADADGRLFEGPADQWLPVLEGWSGRAAPGRALDVASRRLLAAVPGFPDVLRNRVVRLGAGERITVHLEDGTEVRFGEPRDLAPKALAASSVLELAADRGELLEYVDVRTPGSPVARSRNSPEPEA